MKNNFISMFDSFLALGGAFYSAFSIKNLLLLFIMNNAFMACNPTCEEKGEHDTYIVENKSVKKIEWKIMNYFSDTIIPVEYNALTDNGRVIQPNSTYSAKVKLGRGECIEDAYENGIKYWIYFFDADSLQVIPWDTVRITSRGVLERRIIDLAYLQSNEFKIVYE